MKPKIEIFKKFLKRTRKYINKLIDYIFSALIFYGLFKFIKYITGCDNSDILIVLGLTLITYNILHVISIVVIYILEDKTKENNITKYE